MLTYKFLSGSSLKTLMNLFQRGEKTMDIHPLISELGTYIQSVNQYSFYLQHYKHASISSWEINFADDLLKGFLAGCWSFLSTNEYITETLEEYPYADCKSTIEYRKLNHDSIKDRIEILRQSFIDTSIAYNPSSDHKPNGYIIKTSNPLGINALFITMANPIKTYNNSKIFYHVRVPISGNEYKQMQTSHLLQLIYHFDAIIFQEKIYFITPKMEAPLNIPSWDKKNKEKCQSEISAVLTDTEYDDLKDAIKSKNAKGFRTYDHARVQKLYDPQEKRMIAQKLNIPLTADNELDLSSDLSKKALLYYLTDKEGVNIDNPNELIISKATMQKLTT